MDPLDPSASLDHWALRDPKESPVPRAVMDYREPWVWLGALDQRAREDRMGLLV